jgi:hypothetical protein
MPTTRTRHLILLATVASGLWASRAEAGEPAAVAPAPTEIVGAGQRRVADLELHPLFSVIDAIGVCLEAFPMREGLSLRGCASVEVIEAGALDVGASYRFPIHRGRILTMGVGPGAGVHWIYDTLQGPLIAWTTDVFASFEAVWWGDAVGFQAQVQGGAMFLHDRAPMKNLGSVSPIVDLTVGLAFRLPR